MFKYRRIVTSDGGKSIVTYRNIIFGQHYPYFNKKQNNKLVAKFEIFGENIDMFQHLNVHSYGRAVM